MRKLVSGVVPIIVVACLLTIVGASPTAALSPKKSRGALEVVCVDRGDQSLRVPSGSCARDEDRVRVTVAERLRVRRGLLVPNNDGAWFCAAPGSGALREIQRPGQCRTGRALESRNHRPGAPELSDTEVPENVPSGTAVGALTARDQDAADRMTYRIVGGADRALFDVVDGALVTSARFDFETRAEYQVRVQVTDLLGLSRAATFDITVVDAQENRPPTDVSLGGAQIAENEPAGSLVGRLDTTDPDLADAHTYTLVTEAGVGNDNPLFTIVGDELRTVAPLDFEAGEQLDIRVRTDDGAGGSLERNLSVSVTDAPDAPTAIGLAPSTIPENRAGDVGKLTVTDQDEDDAHRFSLVPGAGDRDNATFAVSGDRLTLVSPADFEQRSSLTARVRVTDADGLTYEQPLTVTVTNEGEAPVGVSLAPASVRENEPAGTRVGTLSDGGGGASFALVGGVGGDDNAAFRIQGTDLLTTESFDYEADASRTVRVRATGPSGLTTESVLTVTVLNRNEAATRLDLSSSAVDEDAEIGTVVGTLSTDDPDLDDPITYVLTDDAGGRFSVDGDELVTAADLDSDVATSHTVGVRAEDAAGETVDATFVISVENVNEAPSAPSINDDTVDESLAAGTAVGQLTATDPDAGDTLTYALVAGQGDDDNDAFVLTGGTLETAAAFNHETQATYSIRVRVTDSGTPALATEAVLTINVADVNEAPGAPSLDPASIAENQAPGTLVGTLSATDPDSGDTLSYTLIDALDSAHFSVVAGAVYALDSFDFEGTDSYTIEVEVTDGDETASATLTITVTDANDAPSGVSLSPASIAENAAARALGTLSTTDEDTGDTHTYTLPDGEADNSEFEIDGDELRTTGTFDHETQPTLDVLVRSTDEAGAYVEQIFTITVGDVNEAPTAISLAAATLRENAGPQDAGTLSATDAEGGTMTYELASGAGDDDNGSFEIDGTTLRATESFDFETQPTLSVRVKVTDGGGLSHTEALTVQVTDVDDPPTGFVFATGGSVAENQPMSTVVGDLDVIDEDGYDHGHFEMLNGLGSVTITGRSGSIRTRGPLDHETTPTLTVTVRINDSVGIPLYTGPVTITVTDVNEAPTSIDLTPSSVDENLPAGTTVGALSAADPDDGDADPAFALVAGTGDTDNALFEIVGDELVTTDEFDHEDNASYSVRVRATDAGGLSFAAPVTVAVNQVNEAPSVTPSGSLSVAENLAAGTTVATIAGTDPESDALTWSLVSGTGSTDNAKFTIGTDGVLKTAAGLDHEADAQLQVRVRVSDGSLTDELALTVDVTDANDAPTPQDDAFSGAIGNTAGRAGSATLVGSGGYTTLSGALPQANDTDQDAGDSITIVATTGIATTLGGTVDLAANGSFMYYPPAGVKGQTDTFEYSVEDSEDAVGTAEVSITIGNRRVWYVGSIGASGTPDGTSRLPFTSLGSTLSGSSDVDEIGDDLFLYSNVTGSLDLEQGQRLLGGAAGLPGVTLSSSTRPQFSASGGYAVALANGSSIDGINLVATGSGDVVRATSVTTSTIGSSAAITHIGTGVAVSITGAASGDITIDAAVSAGSASGVRVSNRSGGTVTFAKRVTTSTGASTGVVLTGNTGATIAFPAGVQLSATGQAFAATGGGTVTVAAGTPASTLTSTAGTALTVQNTTIGASGLNFARIDATGGVNGIRLENTGTVGTLTVTGSSAGTCGGTRMPTGGWSSYPNHSDCTGGVISEATGAGISLASTKAPSFTRIAVLGSEGDGLSAQNVDGLTIVNSSFLSNGDAVGENGVDLGGSGSAPYAGATGTVTITDTAIGASGDTNLFSGTSSGTTTLSLLRNMFYTLVSPSSVGAEDGVRVEATSGGTVNLTLSGSYLSGNRGDHAQVVASGTGRVESARITTNTAIGGGRGIQVAAGGSPFSGTLGFDIADNTLSGQVGPAIAVVGGNVNGTGFMGHVRRNAVGQSGVAGSCASAGDGILVSTEDGTGSLTVGVSNNTVYRCVGRGIAVEATGGAAAVNATVASNTVTLPDAGASEALSFAIGMQAADTGRSCLSTSSNVLVGGPAKTADLALVHRYGALDLAGITGTPNAAAVQAWLSGANPVTSAVAATTPVNGSYSGVTTCPTAPN